MSRPRTPREVPGHLEEQAECDRQDGRDPPPPEDLAVAALVGRDDLIRLEPDDITVSRVFGTGP